MILATPFNFLASSSLMMSTIMVMSSSNWLFLWISLELNLLSFIPLMMSTNNFQETEAAVKYFLIQALGSSLMLMSSMSSWFTSSLPMNLMPSILMMAMVLKIGMAPCHMWYSSVMTSISWSMSLILSTWQKIAPLSILTFLLQSMNSKLMMILAGLNALVGGLMGMNQSHFRTILAYSSITHLGWMSALIYIGSPTLTFTYFIMYVIVVAPLFILMIKSSMTTNSQSPSIMNMSPHMSWMIPILLMSIGGLPPLTGFIPKWMSITIIANMNPLLLIILITGSMMNLYYYLNIVFSMMLSSSKSVKLTQPLPYKSFSFSYLAMMSTSALFFAPMFFMF